LTISSLSFRFVCLVFSTSVRLLIITAIFFVVVHRLFYINNNKPCIIVHNRGAIRCPTRLRFAPFHITNHHPPLSLLLSLSLLICISNYTHESLRWYDFACIPHQLYRPTKHFDSSVLSARSPSKSLLPLQDAAVILWALRASMAVLIPPTVFVPAVLGL
jgi:hypothetical protein